MTQNGKLNIKQLLICAVFAAVTAVCAQIAIPLSVVPINLALLAVHLAGALLGAKLGVISIASYVLLGALGVPVFAHFSGGIAIVTGVTGGYIMGYILAALTVGLISTKGKHSYARLCAAMAAGTFVCYAFGTAWYMLQSGNALLASLTACVLPFLPGDALKIALAAYLTRRLDVPLKRYLA